MRKIKNCIVVGRLLFGCSTNVLFFFVNIIVTDYLFCGKKGNNNHRNVFVCAKTIRSLLWHATLIWRSLTSIPNIKFNLTAAIRYFDHIFHVCLFLLFFHSFSFYLLLYDSKKKDHKTNQNKPNGMNAVIFIHWKCAVCFIDENDQNIDSFLFNLVFYLMWLQWTVNDGEQTQFGVALYVLKIHTFSLVLFEQ